MQEKLDALVRTQAMQLFRQQGLHFTMQQVAEPLHISKKTIYTVYPSKEALLLDMVDTPLQTSTAASRRFWQAAALCRRSCGRSSLPCRQNTPRWTCGR